MTGRDNRGNGPGRGIAGAVAMAMLLVLGAQGAIGAPSDKKPREEKKTAAQAGARKPAENGAATAAPTARPQAMVTRSVGGATVAIDPSTGRLQPPTAEEAAALAAGLQHMLTREAEGLPVVELPDGTLMMDLQDTFQEVAMATVDRRGNIRLQCVNDAAQAMALLNGTAAISPDTAVYGASKAAEKKTAVKAGRPTAEKE